MFHGKQRIIKNDSHFRSDGNRVLIDASDVHAGCGYNASSAFSIEWLWMEDPIACGIGLSVAVIR